MGKIIVALVWIMGGLVLSFGVFKLIELTKLPDPVKFSVVFADGRRDVCGYIASILRA